MANKAPSVALVISNQYENIPKIKLSGCYADADNFINSIKKINPKTKFIIMRDNLPKNSPFFPTKANIIAQLNSFCTSPEIVSFLYYSGHGTSVVDTNKDESSNIVGLSNAIIERNSNDSSNGQFKDSCIVTNEGSTYGLLIDDDINKCFKKLSSNKRVYAFFDSCNSGTIIDLYSVYFSNPKNTKKFFASTLNELLTEMKKPENNTSILNAYYPNKMNDINGIVVLISGTRDNTYSYEGKNLGIISGNLTSRLCWLLNNGIGKLSINDFYLLIVGLLNDSNQIPVLSCSKFISLTQTTMRDFDIGIDINNALIPFTMGNGEKNKDITNFECELESDYNTSDEEITVINMPLTETDNEIKNQLAIAAKQEAELAAKQEAELAAKQEAELAAKQEAELAAKQEAELAAKQEAELAAKQEAELAAKQEAELAAKQEAELKAKQEAELAAKQEAELKAKQEAELKAKQEAELAAKQEAELKAKQEAELKAKQEAELKAKQEAELKAKQEAELKAKQEAELKAKQEAELKAKQEAELKAKRLAQIKRETEAKAKKEAEDKAKKEAEDKAKKEEEERLRKEAEEKSKIKGIGNNAMLYKNVKQVAMSNSVKTVVIEQEKKLPKDSNTELVIIKAKQYAVTRVGLFNQQKKNKSEHMENNLENKPNVVAKTGFISGSNYVHYLMIKKQ